MKIDVVLSYEKGLHLAADAARTAEALGFDGLWTAETQHDAFLPLVLAAEHTQRIQLGTAIAVAFARSPTELAYTAWDLQSLSQGRFILGLGTQVKAHIERRFGMPWDSPTARLREMILGMRALWNTWQTGAKLNFRGEFYKLTLMAPFFNPGPIEHPHIPIFIAGVNKGLCQLAGELCEGFHVHPFHSTRYLREVTLPNITLGLEKSGRTRADIQLSSSIFVITGQTPAEVQTARQAVRAQIAFYASTPSYHAVMETHGWLDTAERLGMMAARQQWPDMAALIDDEMLEAFAVTGAPDELAGLIQRRYAGLLDRINYYVPFVPGESDDYWRRVAAAFHA